jgi:hypothetical protein
MTESEFYRRIIRPLLVYQGFMVQRFEQETIPDVYAARNDHSLWIELKVVRQVRASVVAPAWRPGQLAWLKRLNDHCQSLRGIVAIQFNNKTYFAEPKRAYTMEGLVLDHAKVLPLLRR